MHSCSCIAILFIRTLRTAHSVHRYGPALQLQHKLPLCCSDGRLRRKRAHAVDKQRAAAASSRRRRLRRVAGRHAARREAAARKCASNQADGRRGRKVAAMSPEEVRDALDDVRAAEPGEHRVLRKRGAAELQQQPRPPAQTAAPAASAMPTNDAELAAACAALPPAERAKLDWTAEVDRARTPRRRPALSEAFVAAQKDLTVTQRRAAFSTLVREVVLEGDMAFDGAPLRLPRRWRAVGGQGGVQAGERPRRRFRIDHLVAAVATPSLPPRTTRGPSLDMLGTPRRSE